MARRNALREILLSSVQPTPYHRDPKRAAVVEPPQRVFVELHPAAVEFDQLA